MKKCIIDVSENIKNKKTIFGISGRPLGEQQRKVLEIDKKEEEYQKIIIVVPRQYLSVSSSFFLGLLGKSVRKCGTRDAFLNKFEFECSSNIMESVEEGIKDALRTGSGLNI